MYLIVFTSVTRRVKVFPDNCDAVDRIQFLLKSAQVTPFPALVVLIAENWKGARMER